MCTIGAVRNESNGKCFYFKNLDQPDAFTFAEPAIVQGRLHRYLKLPSGRSLSDKGSWAGVNERGLVVLGADGNCMPNFVGGRYASLNESLIAYEQALSECATAPEAMHLIMDLYQQKNVGGNGDIILVGDGREAIAMEYSPNRWGIQYRNEMPYMIRTNFFLLLDRLRPQPEENSVHTSSAMRYADAMGHLSIHGKNSELDDVFRLVRSHVNGPSALSICRHGGAGEYATHCSFVAEIAPSGISAYVVVNNAPCKSDFKRYTF